jgi:hypothetical protein
MKQSNNTFSTVDLRLASFLRLRKFELLQIKKGENEMGIFVFRDKPGRAELVLNFLNRQEVIEPIAFAEECKNLKGASREVRL